MLQFIRDNATGWIAWGIVILIAIPFALWGIHQYVTPTSSVAVATVDGADIDYYDFQRRYARRRQELQATFGAGFADMLDDVRLRREVLERMVDSEVVVNSGVNAGMRVGDALLAGSIRSQEAFRSGNGAFSQDVYEGWLRTQGYSPGGFEESFRRSILEQQIALGISGSDFIPENGLREAVRVRLQKRTFSLLTIPAADFESPEPTDSEIGAHFERHRSEYFVPERLRLRYLEVSMSAIAAGVKADDDELRALFDAGRESFVTPEKREASHILVSVESAAGEDAVEEARARAAGFRERIVAGESFEDVAKEHSDDPGSASAGGALGFIDRGMMDPAFEEAAFALAPDEVSDPVRSNFGWHLVKVTSVQEARETTFEEVRDEVLAQYQSREAERIYVERVETLANVAYEHPESLEPAARELELPILETGYVTRDGDGDPDDPIASQPAVVAAAFSSDVLGEGNNSEPIEFEPGHIVVVRAFDHEPRRSLELDEAREEVIDALRAEAVRAAVVARGRELLASLRGGRSPDEVAADAGVEWSRFEEVGRFDGEVPEQLLDVVFRMPRPGGDGRFDGLIDDAGDFVLVSLSRVADGNVSALSDEEREDLRQALETDLGRTAYDAFVRVRRESADVEINEQNLRNFEG